MLYLTWKNTVRPKAWGILLAFNCVGSWDYANGHIAQYLHPAVAMLGDPAEPVMAFGPIGLGMVSQTATALLLLRTGVMLWYMANKQK